MKTERILFIVRHAKSSWDYGNISDLDRPLKLKGIRDSYDVARQIKLDATIPDIFISSPAIRALHTANIFLRIFETDFKRLKIDDRLYDTSIGVIKKLLSEQDPQKSQIMIFGHNPDFSELAAFLSGKAYVELPTCGVCKIIFDCTDWKSISADSVKEVVYGNPVHDTLE